MSLKTNGKDKMKPATLNADRVEYYLFEERVSALKRTGSRTLTAKRALEQALILWRQLPGDTSDEVLSNALLAPGLVRLYRRDGALQQDQDLKGRLAVELEQIEEEEDEARDRLKIGHQRGAE